MLSQPQGRVGDNAFAPEDKKVCDKCPHPVAGPAVQGSPNVFVNGRAALTVNSPGKHSASASHNSTPNTWKATKGSKSVFINKRPVHRMNDATQHVGGGTGKLTKGSPNVFVGDGGGKPAETEFCKKCKDCLKTADEQIDFAKEMIQEYGKALENTSNLTGEDIQGAVVAAMEKKYGDGIESMGTTYLQGNIEVKEQEGSCADLLESATQKHETSHQDDIKLLQGTLIKKYEGYGSSPIWPLETIQEWMLDEYKTTTNSAKYTVQTEIKSWQKNIEFWEDFKKKCQDECGKNK